MKDSQKGFTLVETLMAVAIAAAIGTVLAVSLSQAVSISWSGNKRIEAIKQVENAAYHINRDAQAARSISTSTPGYWLVITPPEGSNISYEIITPEDSGPAYLQRICGSTATPVARYIDTGPGLTACSYSGGLLDVKVTATLGGFQSASETRRLLIYPRLNLSGP